MQQSDLKDRILNEALAQAEVQSWEQLHLHAIAGALNISLDAIRQFFPQKDDLVEAWFDRADQAMLGEYRPGEFFALPLHERLQQVIESWLDALSPHRRVTREMLAYKLEFGHVHLQALGIMRISRTVQWFREAARHDSTGLQRILDETALTALYLATFARWLFDSSTNCQTSRDFLKAALQNWHRTGCLESKLASGTTGSEELRQPAGQ